MPAVKKLRADAARIWSAALAAVDAERAVGAAVRLRGRLLRVAGAGYDLRRAGRIWVLGAGKAAAPMARALEARLDGRITGGLVTTKDGHGLPLRTVDLAEAGHPLPDERGLEAGRRIRELASGTIAPGDLVFCVLSGGGSALLVAPAEGIALADKLRTTDLLLRAGATIHELNAVRKHLSTLKGGGLARLLERNRVISLILSDVVGDDLDTIASGPLVPDRTTFRDCAEILRKYGIEGEVPEAVRRRIRDGVAGRIPETPKPGDAIFRRKRNVVVGSNSLACSAALREARRLGYRATVLTSRLEGDTGEAARFHCSVLEEIIAEGRPLRRPSCILTGGETTVHVTGMGKGGRNQEFVLHTVPVLARLPAPCVVASLGTDGTDGPTDAAGAIADNSTLTRSLRYGAHFLQAALENNDSYHFFERLGDLIVTGPTRTNVMDLHIALVG